VFLKLLLSVIDVLVSFVLQFDCLLHSLVSFSSSLSFLDHSVDVIVTKTSTTLNLDTLLLSSGLVLGGDIHDTVSINVKCNFDLWVTTRSHWDALKLEVTKLLVIFSELTLSLQDTDSDFGLVVGCSREDLTLLGWDGGVTSDKLCADTTHRLNTER